MSTRTGVIAGLSIAIVVLSCAIAGTIVTRVASRPGPVAQPYVPVPAAPPPTPVPPTPGELFRASYAADCARFPRLEGDALAAALEDWSATRSDTSYPMLERNAEAHFGELAVFSGRIEEIRDEQGGTIARLSTGGYGSDVLWVETCWADAHLVSGNRARVYGYLAGAHTYTTQAGWTMTIPSLLAVAAVPTSLPEHVSPARRARLGL